VYGITPAQGRIRESSGQISHSSPQLTPAQDCERKRKFRVPRFVSDNQAVRMITSLKVRPQRILCRNLALVLVLVPLIYILLIPKGAFNRQSLQPSLYVYCERQHRGEGVYLMLIVNHTRCLMLALGFQFGERDRWYLGRYVLSEVWLHARVQKTLSKHAQHPHQPA